MANQTTRFGFQLLYESQSQKSVVINQNEVNLDALLMMSNVSSTLTAPPASPADQAVYIVAVGATGTWAGHDRQVAIYQAANASWLYFAPAIGWTSYDQALAATLIYTIAGWSVLATVITGNNLATLAALASVAGLVDIANLTQTAGNIIASNGTHWTSETPMQAVGPTAAMMAIIYGG